MAAGNLLVGATILLLFAAASTIVVAESGVPSTTVDLVFFGDIMVGRRIESLILDYGADHFLSGVSLLPNGQPLGAFDLVSANLEGAITAGGEKAPPVYPYDFAFPPERIAALRDGGISFVTIANNHLYDQGHDGVASTRRYLTELGIDHSGDLDRLVSDHSVTYIERNGVTFGMIGLSEVYGPLNRDEVRHLVAETDAAVDLTIVNVHWGVEYEHQPRRHQRDMARILVWSGADLVIGHHPHVTQGVEVVDGVPVCYSLGNFIFDQAFSDEVQQGYAVAVTLEVEAPKGASTHPPTGASTHPPSDASTHSPTGAAGFQGATSFRGASAVRGESPGFAISGRLSILPYRAGAYVPRWLTGDERTARLRRIAAWSYGDAVREAVESGVIHFDVPERRVR